SAGGIVCAGFGQSSDDAPNAAQKGGLTVSGVAGVRALALGQASGCAIVEDGGVACFPLSPIAAGGGDRADTCRHMTAASVCWTKSHPRMPPAATTLDARKIAGVGDV